ncbi:MAG: Gfo/Idh/MocA family oxidoreductase [Phycisphaerae bacterium]|nr:Gfo/Idh/MocA family oxidoreductase [Phycisphaerae bacterium]
MRRRTFLRRMILGGTGVSLLKGDSSARGYRANEKLNVALVGVGGRGEWFVDTIPKMENVVALCDVNDQKLAAAFQRWARQSRALATSPHDWERGAAEIYTRILRSKPRTFHDFREMLDTTKDIDAVVVATPDHSHAVISAAAIRAGKHVLCEKPLSRTVHESRALHELAHRYKVATSMGNQGTAAGPFRRALELIRGGALGEIKEVHIWNDGGGADRKEPPSGTEPVPEYLKWDLWLGPAAFRPYRHEWLQWHQWREFGTCQLGNWGSHTANLAFMALKVYELWLGEPSGVNRPVIRVEAKSSSLNRLSFPRWELIQWHIPARAEFPPIMFTWYNGQAPGASELIDSLKREAADKDRQGIDFSGAYIVGTKGRIHATGHNATFRLLPEEQFKDVQRDRPETVESSRGHEMDWLLACRGGKPAWANFDYADALNEFLMIGNVSTQVEGRLDFEPVGMKIANHGEADALLRSEYRKGWTL